MARLVLFLCIIGFCCSLLRAGEIPAIPPAPLISARAAVLMDRQTGLVLWSYNPDVPLPMASTTKIMTAIVILDHGADKLDQMVVVSKKAAATGGSSLLAAGDTLSLRNLLRSILIRSSNEAAVAAAEYLTGGNVELFVRWMNEKAAKILGPNNHTHFVNPHGLYDKELGAQHYASARDLALITREALTNYPLIRQIVASGDPPHWVYVNSYPRGVLKLENHNRILGEQVPGIPGACIDGVKTGFVVESGKCLVSSATLDGWQLIAVVLGGDNHYFQESRDLLHFGFSRYQWMTYASEAQPGATARVSWGAFRSVPVGTRGILGAPLPRLAEGDQINDRIEFRGKRLSAPIRAGQNIGELVLKRNGRVILTVPAIALQGVPVAWWSRALSGMLYTALIFFGLYVIGKIYGTIAKNRRRRRRRLQAASRGTHPGGTYYR